MLVERVELTLSHVDLGHLGESAAMTLLGTAHAHRLVEGTGHSIREITDASGARLYPGYYWTHLQVPPTRLLRRHQLWDTVTVGVEVGRFGSLLASTYVLGAPDDITSEMTPDARSAVVSMRGANLLVIDDGSTSPRPAMPKRGSIAELPAVTNDLPELKRFRELRDLPSIDPAFVGSLTARAPIEYRLRAGHQIHGEHSVMFARFIGIADAIERALLVEHTWPPVPVALVSCLEVLERETCFFANVRGEHTLRGAIRGELSACPPGFSLGDQELVAAALWTAVIELYDEQNVLLLSTKVTKVLAIPAEQQRLVGLATRTLATHGHRKES